MDIKKLLEKEFSKENEFNNLLKVKMPDDKSISSEKFNDKFSKYINDYKTKENDYINNVKKSVSLYESRLNAEDLFARKDKIYQNALAKKQSNDFYNAYVEFGSIKGHKDSDALCKECLDILEAKYNDAIAKKQIGEFDSAISILEQIKPFKDSEKLIIKFRSDKKIYSKKDSIYNSALSSFNAGKYYDALMSFQSILGHKDSNDYINECNVLLEEKYNEAQKLFNSQNYNDALVAFKNIVSYKDTIEMVRKCEKAIEDEKERNKKNAQLAKQAAAKKKKKRIIITVSSIVCAVIAVIIILVTAVFIPNAQLKENTQKYENGITLINNGQYKEASEIFNGLNFKDSNNLYSVSKAGESFKTGNYNDGIKNMCAAKGSTFVSYDLNGGTSPKTQETITTYAPISNTCTKDYYSFSKWDMTNFSIFVEPNSYEGKLHLKADFSIINYHISYNLNGGTNNSSNPATYNYESSNINLYDPSKTGYQFTGWTCNGQSITSIPHHSSGDKNLTANWKAKTYTVNLDANGGTYSGQSSYTVTYNSSCTFPTPTKHGCFFLGWYYNETKVGSTWTIDANCTIKAKWEYSSLQYLDYGKYNSNKEIYIKGLKGNYPYSELILPDSIDGLNVTLIYDNAFYNVSGITSIEMPDTIVEIDTYAFARMPDLKSIKLSNKLSYLDDYAFYQCTALETIELPNTLEHVGTHVLIGCSSLTKIKTELSSKYCIGYFFSSIQSDVSNLTVPSSLKTIEVTKGTVIPKQFFKGLGTVTNFIFDENITEVGESAFAGAGAFVCPSSVKKIGAFAYSEMGKIGDEITLPEGLEEINEWAFFYTYFKTINLPSTLKALGEAVFAGYARSNNVLKTINFNGTKAKWISFAGEKPNGNYGWAYNLEHGFKIYCTDAYYTDSLYSSECVWTNY